MAKNRWKHPKKKSGGRKVLKAAFLVGAVLLLILICFKFFVVKDVRIDGDPDFSEDVIGATSTFRLKSLILLRKDSVKEVVKKGAPGIKDIAVSKEYPQTLVISYSARRPIGAIFSLNGTGYLFDNEGYILDLSENNAGDYLRVYTYLDDSVFHIGKQLEVMKNSCILYLGSKAPSNQTLEKLELSKSVNLYFSSGINVKLPLKCRDNSKIELMRRLLSHFSIEKKGINVIDLRFDNPYVSGD